MSANEASNGNTMELAAPYLISSVEHTAEVQKQYIGVAATQLGNLIALNRQFLRLVPGPFGYMLDAAERSLHKGVEVQKNLIDAAVEHCNAAVRISRSATLSEANEQLMAVVRKAFEQATATYKELLDFALDETQKAAALTGKKEPPKLAPSVAPPPMPTPIVVPSTEPAVELATQTLKRNLAAIVDVPETVVDVAVKPRKPEAAKLK